MKKLTACLFICIFLLTVSFTASASPECTVSADNTVCRQGENVSVGIHLSRNPGLAALYVKIKYDSNAVSTLSVETTDMLEDFIFYDDGCGSLILSWEPALYDNTSNGKLADIVFTVSASAKIGDSLLTLEIPECGAINAATDEIYVAVSDSVITVMPMLDAFSETLDIDRESMMIQGIAPGITPDELLAQINDYALFTIAGVAFSDDLSVVSTGMTLFPISNVSRVYTLIVRGDTNGDGRVTVADMTAIQRVLLGKASADGITAAAMDVDLDGMITEADFDAVKAHITGSAMIK